MHGYIHRKDDVLKRLRRIEGQTRGLQRMVDEDTYCIDILTQVAAVTKALQAVSLSLLEDHMNHCVVDAARAGEQRGPREGHRGRRRDRPAGAVMTTTTTYDVTGMTCGHCELSVQRRSPSSTASSRSAPTTPPAGSP